MVGLFSTGQKEVALHSVGAVARRCRLRRERGLCSFGQVFHQHVSNLRGLRRQRQLHRTLLAFLRLLGLLMEAGPDGEPNIMGLAVV